MPEVATAPEDSNRFGIGRAIVDFFRKGWVLPVALVALLSLIVVVLVLLIVNPPWEDAPLPEVQGRLQSMSKEDLEAEKLRQEIVELELDSRTAGSLWGLILSYMPFLTAIGAGGVAFAAIWRQITARIAQQDQDRRQRDVENQRRFDENFTKVVENLGSASPALQASAAVSLATFLKPAYSTFHDQVSMVVLANLKIEHAEAVNDLLIPVFGQAIRARLPSASPEDRQFLLNLSRATLNRIDLSGLDLSEADLGYARIRGANLTGANLRRSRGIDIDLEKTRLSDADLSEARLRGAHCRGAQFYGANLVSARLEEADLRGAQFQEAQLQEAHLQNAKLQGARFEGANLNNTFLAGAAFDARALKSVATGARNWRKAHFDPNIRDQLDDISQASSS